MRRILLPGTHVAKRRDGSLQIGLDRADAVVLPDTEDVRRALAGLPAPDSLTDALVAKGLLVPERPVREALRPTEDGRGSRRAAMAVVRTSGAETPDVVRRRAESTVHLSAFGPAPDLLRLADTLLGEAGVSVAHGEARGRPGASVRLHVGLGEPPREHLDECIRRQQPHLLVRLREGRAVLGPFVAPGRTACLRCLDAHDTDADPSWPLVLQQHVTVGGNDRSDGVPEPVDPALAAVVVGWAVRDVLTFVDGGRPTSWSATLRLDPLMASVETTGWLRHPACGCTW